MKTISDPIKILSPAERWAPSQSQMDSAQNDYTYTPLYIRQDKWEDMKNDLKSFSDVVKMLEVRDL